MKTIKLMTFLHSKKIVIITLMVIVAIAWLLGQLIVPAVMKVVFLGGM